MASKALISYANSTGGYCSLTIEQSSNTAGAFDETSVLAFAEAVKPADMEVTSVRWAPEYIDIPLA